MTVRLPEVVVLDRLGVDDLVTLSYEIRSIGRDATSMMEVSQRICDHLRERLRREDGDPAVVAVQSYRTHPTGRLPARYAVRGATRTDRTLPSLVLLGASPSHDAPPDAHADIALPLKPGALGQAPLMAQMLFELGVGDVAASGDVFAVRPVRHSSLKVFRAPFPGGDWLVDQDGRVLVEVPNAEEVLCVGGRLPMGNVHLLCFFVRRGVNVPDEALDLLGSLGRAVRAALIPQSFHPFDDH